MLVVRAAAVVTLALRVVQELQDKVLQVELLKVLRVNFQEAAAAVQVLLAVLVEQGQVAAVEMAVLVLQVA